MSLMYLQMGHRALGAYAGYSAQRHSSKMAEIQKHYQNVMADIAAAQQNNTQTMNEVEVRDAFVRTGIALEVQAMKDQGSAEASAAAAGVKGGSVNSALRGLMRSHMQSKAALTQRKDQQHRANTQARRNIALNRAFSKNRDIIPQPSAASALLGLGAQMIDVYDSHQTPGETTSDAIAEWWT